MISLERLVERGYLDACSTCPSFRTASRCVTLRAFERRSCRLLREAARNFLQGARSPSARERYDAFCSENSGGWKTTRSSAYCANTSATIPGTPGPRKLPRARPGGTGAVALGPERPAGAGALPAIRLLRTMESPASLLRRPRHSHHRRRRDLRQLRQCRCLDPSRHLSLATKTSRRKSWPVCRPTPSARPVSAGAIRSTTGTALKSRGYDWWIQRMRWAVETCDIVRLDHFRGYEACWEIPADEPTAVNGHWTPGPNDDLFKALQERTRRNCRSSPKTSATSRQKFATCARSSTSPA